MLGMLAPQLVLILALLVSIVAVTLLFLFMVVKEASRSNGASHGKIDSRCPKCGAYTLRFQRRDKSDFVKMKTSDFGTIELAEIRARISNGYGVPLYVDTYACSSCSQCSVKTVYRFIDDNGKVYFKGHFDDG